jgi:hypothetical protein
MIVVEQYWQPWATLIHSLKTGEPAFELVFGMDVWEWRRVHRAKVLCSTPITRRRRPGRQRRLSGSRHSRVRASSRISAAAAARWLPRLSARTPTSPASCSISRKRSLARGPSFNRRIGVDLVAGDFTIAIPVEAVLRCAGCHDNRPIQPALHPRHWPNLSVPGHCVPRRGASAIPHRLVGRPTLWLWGHALFRFWEVAVGICGPSAIARDFPAVTLPALLGTILTLWAVANARAERVVPART